MNVKDLFLRHPVGVDVPLQARLREHPAAGPKYELQLAGAAKVIEGLPGRRHPDPVQAQPPDRIFRAMGSLSPDQQKRILDLDGLTPGDMRAVHGQHRHKDPAEVSHDTLIAALERELSYRPENGTAKIGF